MSSNNSEQDFDEVNNSDHSTEREGTAGQDGNSSTDVSPGGEHISHSTERKETVGQEGNSSSEFSPEGEAISIGRRKKQTNT